MSIGTELLTTKMSISRSSDSHRCPSGALEVSSEIGGYDDGICEG